MTELSDYRRMVERPMVKRYEERIANLIAEIERLRALTSPQPSDEEVERVANGIETELLRQYTMNPKWDVAKDVIENLNCRELAIAAMSPRPQPGMISADRACEIIGALIEQYEAPSAKDIQEACNTIRMEASALPEPPKE